VTLPLLEVAYILVRGFGSVHFPVQGIIICQSGCQHQVVLILYALIFRAPKGVFCLPAVGHRFNHFLNADALGPGVLCAGDMVALRQL